MHGADVSQRLQNWLANQQLVSWLLKLRWRLPAVGTILLICQMHSQIMVEIALAPASGWNAVHRLRLLGNFRVEIALAPASGWNTRALMSASDDCRVEIALAHASGWDARSNQRRKSPVLPEDI